MLDETPRSCFLSLGQRDLDKSIDLGITEIRPQVFPLHEYTRLVVVQEVVVGLTLQLTLIH